MEPAFPVRRLLLPLVPLYRLALAVREFGLRSGLEPVRRLRFPVVSIGNLSTGGSGKTPLAIALAKALTARGQRVDVLSRGYGRQSRLAARVNPDGSAGEFGDEPLLIAREAGVPVYVAPRRYDAGRLAEAEALEVGGQEQPLVVHLLDDGFQHRQLYRDIDILLFNRQDWHGTLLPAGNLREPLPKARRATVIAIPADDLALAVALKTWGWRDPIWRLHRFMDTPETGGPVLPFCGIARPEQFFAGLEAAGLHAADRIVFPDHHRYTARDLNRLVALAHRSAAAALITTEKDRVRLGALISVFPEWLPLFTVKLRVEIENQDAALDWLISRLSAPPESQ
jgi:tetraacyldisaccharide 4'-kinase